MKKIFITVAVLALMVTPSFANQNHYRHYHGGNQWHGGYNNHWHGGHNDYWHGGNNYYIYKNGNGNGNQQFWGGVAGGLIGGIVGGAIVGGGQPQYNPYCRQVMAQVYDPYYGYVYRQVQVCD